jgi:hypothetical protein
VNQGLSGGHGQIKACQKILKEVLTGAALAAGVA